MAKSQGRIAGAVPRRQKQRRQGGSPGAAQLQGIASFVALPLPMRLGGAAAAAGRSAAGATRRYHFVKRLKPKPTPDAEVAAPSGDADDGGDDPRLRTILIANFDGVEAELRRVYGAYGAIEAASCPGGRGGEASTKGIARVVFEDRQAVDAVMGVSAARAEEEAAAVAAAEQELAEGVTAMAEADSDGDGDDDDDDDDDGISINLGSPEGSADSDAAEPEARPKTGLRKWLSEHFQARPGIAALQARVDALMEGYDERRREEERRQAAALNVPDEDGFITVTRGVKRGGRTANSDGTVHVKAGSAARALAAEAAATAAAKSQGLRDFYRFQTRDKRQAEVTSLRQQFQEDRLKLARVRELRLLSEEQHRGEAPKRQRI